MVETIQNQQSFGTSATTSLPVTTTTNATKNNNNNSIGGGTSRDKSELYKNLNIDTNQLLDNSFQQQQQQQFNEPEILGQIQRLYAEICCFNNRRTLFSSPTSPNINTTTSPTLSSYQTYQPGYQGYSQQQHQGYSSQQQQQQGHGYDRHSIIIQNAENLQQILHDILSLCTKQSYPNTPSLDFSLKGIEERMKRILSFNLDDLKDLIEKAVQFEQKRSRFGEMRVDQLKDILGSVFLR
ncbi:hypothetical protein ABK040_011227 [Willaertia magna]